MRGVMSPEPDPRLAAAVDRLLRGLRPVPAPPRLVERVMSALPPATAGPTWDWLTWPWWIRGAVLTFLSAATGLLGWAMTVYLIQPAGSQLSTVLAPLWVLFRATGMLVHALGVQVSQLPSAWLWLAVGVVGSAVIVTALLGVCCVRLCCVPWSRSTTPAFKGYSP